MENGGKNNYNKGMKKIEIAPSILSADFFKLNEEIKSLKEEGASYLHFDVMDGHFVPNISFGAYVLKCIKDKTDLIMDVHLMISDPIKYYLDFVNAGADLITFHYEAIDEKDIIPLINKIHENNVMTGISIKPNTKVEVLLPYLKDIDLVLVMSVEPGFGGQKFLDSALEKIRILNELKIKYNYSYKIEVDGGINDLTYKKVIELGADILVSGSYIFKSKNRKEAIKLLKGEGNE